MGIIAPTLPTIGQPSSTEDADVLNALTTILNEFNGNISASNLHPSLTQAIGVLPQKSILSAEESTSSTSYTLLTTPDRVQGVVLPADGKLRISWHALWQQPTAGKEARAAIFLNDTQLKMSGTEGPALEQEALTGSGLSSGIWHWLSSYWGGLISDVGAGQAAHDPVVTTGQVVSAVVGAQGGVCEVAAAPGTYDVSVQFKTTAGGSVVVKRRKLWVESLGS